MAYCDVGSRSIPTVRLSSELLVKLPARRGLVGSEMSITDIEGL